LNQQRKDQNMNHLPHNLAQLVVGMAFVALAVAPVTSVGARGLTVASVSAPTDSLYVGDGADSTVKQYDAQTPNKYLGLLVKPKDGGLLGPRGLLVQSGQLIVSNQNVGLASPGNILRYDLATGAFADALVPSDAPQSPFAPRGIVLRAGLLFVANMQGPTIADDGTVSVYSAADGSFRGNLPEPAAVSGQFHPRGIVFGPDGRLYVSIRNLPDPCGGSVLRYDVPTNNPAAWKFRDVFVTNPVDCSKNVNDLHRPEGLVFGPDDNLYVTSFLASADVTATDDTDQILIFDPTGSPVGRIGLDRAGGPRTYAQAILFGPGGKLFVPITNTGELRRYDVTTSLYDSFVSTGTLKAPWYLTFGRTDPATLAYQ
jgi:hypothetical protein